MSVTASQVAHFLSIIIHINKVKSVGDIVIYWNTGRIFARWTFSKGVIRHWCNFFFCYYVLNFFFLTKGVTLNIDSGAPSAGQVKLTYFIHFPSHPLEAGLSISPPFIGTSWEPSVSHLHGVYDPLVPERNYPTSSISKYNFLCLFTLSCCNFCRWNILLFLRANYSQG